MYIAQPPLFGAKLGKDERAYLKDEAALAAFEAEHEGRKIEVSRFKGLGEMDWQELGETTMNPATRTLLQVSVEDAAIADEIFSTLMGDDVEPRRELHPDRTPRTSASSTSETRLIDAERNHGMPDEGQQTLGNVEPIEIQEEMERSFLDYAMSVITVAGAARRARRPEAGAAPDPLRHVRRRACGPTGSTASRANAVGDVMGKYHPHGDQAIYDALARMAQDFSLRYPLIDGHGNFGSPDPNDRPAAAALHRGAPRAARDGAARRDRRGHRRLRRRPTTASTSEPIVLPARFPNLLVNGGGGIAVGMATNIPPHNLARGHRRDGAPDRQPRRDRRRPHAVRARAPTSRPARTILGRAGIAECYRTGRGSIRMRAVAEIEEDAQRRPAHRRHRGAVPDVGRGDRRRRSPSS